MPEYFFELQVILLISRIATISRIEVRAEMSNQLSASLVPVKLKPMNNILLEINIKLNKNNICTKTTTKMNRLHNKLTIDIKINVQNTTKLQNILL